MSSPFHINRKVRLIFTKLGSLLLLFQKTPLVQMILPEARVVGTTGVAEIVKWSVATVAGLGAFDTVAGATTMAQIAPTPVVSPLPATTGVSMSLTAQVTGAPGSPQSWQISTGSLPPGITKANSGSTCTLSGIPTTAGSYSFTLKAWQNSNNSGGSISKAFVIDVAQGVTAPTITTNPVSTTINSGSTTTLTVAVSGTSPTFQWYRGSSGTTTNPVSGATSSSFTTPALTSTTTYWAKASNSEGSANSAAATVSIRIPPAITSQPASTTISSGTTTTLNVTASGTSPSFQWYLGNSPNTSSPIAGATSASFTTPVLSSARSYWVRATNAAGTANSETATVNVITPPAITSHPNSTTINSGNTTLLTVSASGTSPSYQWYIGNSGDISNPVIDATSATFTTPALASTTSFWARASNAAGSADSNSATVNVIIPPVFLIHPASLPVNSGGTATLTVFVSGTSPTFQWYLGNSGDISNPIPDATSDTFTTPAIASTTAYWVRASNAAGSADSQTASLFVASVTAPAFTSQPASITINSGSTTTLNVDASGTSPGFQWYTGASGDTAHPVIGATTGSFTTPPLTASTTYWVKVSNSAGFENSNSAVVTVIRPPVITHHPASVSISNGSKTTLAVTVTGTSPTFQWYIGNRGDTSTPINGASSASHTTAALTTTTRFWVRAHNSAGDADSNTATVTVIDPPKITKGPASVIIKKGAATTLTVTATGTSPVFQWYAGTSGTTTSPVSGAHSATFTTLPLSATKTYWVRVTNGAGSANSSTATVTVLAAAAIVKQPAAASIKKSSSATLSVQASGSALKYQWYVGSAGVTTKPVAGATSAKFTTPALKVSTKYWVKVRNAVSSVNSKAAMVTILKPTAQPVRAAQMAGKVPAVGTFEEWQAVRFSAAQLAQSSISAADADPDKDGISNAQEYVLGLSPLRSEAYPTPLFATVGGDLLVSFTAKVATGTGYDGNTRHYALETIDNLDSGTWKPVPGFSDISGSDQKVSYRTTATVPAKFYHLRVWLKP
ncbi:MAG: hypothetical protein ABI162_17645 [Luteolibacter sp.]